MRRFLHVYSAVDPNTGITYLKRTDDGTAGGQSWWIGMLPLDQFLNSINYGFLISFSMDIARIINGETGYLMTPYSATFDPQTPDQSGTHGNPDYSGYALARAQRQKIETRGAGALFKTFLDLPALARQYKAKGDKRAAGIVQFAYDQVIRGVWAITQAFAYIDENVRLG